MKAGIRELYVFTKDHFEKDLNRISPSCVSPIIAVRKVVKNAMQEYIKNYCGKDTKIEDVFSQDDFLEVSNKIRDEIMNNEL